MDLAVEAAESRHLSNFLEQFALRSARMLDADWGAVAVYRDRDTEFHQMPGKGPVSPDTSEWLLANAREMQNEMETRALPREIAANLSRRNQPVAAIFIRIASSDKEKLGTLCLLRKRRSLGIEEKRLLRALASHAALSLENFRRFSQLERSKRQWVEDIDAISDYIVVHDRSWKIARTNRSLASPLGGSPVALVGEATSSLRQSAEAGSDLPCPFCRDTQRTREEYVAASADRIFLISTSRKAGKSGRPTRPRILRACAACPGKRGRADRFLLRRSAEGCSWLPPLARPGKLRDATPATGWSSQSSTSGRAPQCSH